MAQIKEAKGGRTAAAISHMLQCASYAAGVLSMRPAQPCHQCTCDGQHHSLLYYDRQSFSYRDRLISWKIHHDMWQCAAIANLTLPQLGYADVVKPAPLLDNP